MVVVKFVLQDKGTNHKGRKERKEREKEENKNRFIPQFKLDRVVVYHLKIAAPCSCSSLSYESSFSRLK